MGDVPALNMDVLNVLDIESLDLNFTVYPVGSSTHLDPRCSPFRSMTEKHFLDIDTHWCGQCYHSEDASAYWDARRALWSMEHSLEDFAAVKALGDERTPKDITLVRRALHTATAIVDGRYYNSLLEEGGTLHSLMPKMESIAAEVKERATTYLSTEPACPTNVEPQYRVRGAYPVP